MIPAFLFWMGHQNEWDIVPAVSETYAWARAIPIAKLWALMEIDEADWFCLREQLWAMKKGFV